ncbi:MAG: SDR family NAD(P)-dependent oxidoreductase [Burkholderiales bacterium]|nr:SDR family NAD(P)-dependent oxidoreductase [Burkholderiales bacterium]
MQQFDGRVAVITGGGSGLGLAMARRFATAGMKLVLADVQADALAAAVAHFEARGTPVIGVHCDVSKAADVEALKDAAYARFGAVHLLCNNAGVAPGGLAWESTVADWEWTLGVNVYGVIHGLRSFVPAMLAAGEEGHILNTASVAGLLSPGGMGIYCVSKHAVVTLTECLHHDLASRTDRLTTSVLCPAYVPTGIADSERNRPPELRNADHTRSAEDEAREAALRHAVESGRLSADDVANIVHDAIPARRFYILTHPRIKAAIEMRLQDVLAERVPTDMAARRPASAP